MLKLLRRILFITFTILSPALIPAQQVFDFTGDQEAEAALPEPGTETASEVIVIETEDVVIEDSEIAEEPVTSPGQVTVFDRADIEASGARTVADVVERSPGVVVSKQGGILEPMKISIRGGESDHVLVLVNGKAADSLWSGSADLSGMPVSNIERIEVIRGAAAALYGEGAVSGVINIITSDAPADGQSAGAEGELEYGFASFNTHQLRGRFSGPLGSESGFTGGLSGGGLYTGGDYGYLLSDSDQTRLNNDGWAADLSGSLRRADDGGPELLIAASGFASERGSPGLMEFLTPEARIMNIRAGGGADLSLPESPLGNYSLSADYAYRYSRYTNPADNTDDINDDNSLSLSAGWNTDFEAGDALLTVSADASYLFDYLYSTALTDNSGSAVDGSALRHGADFKVRSDVILGQFDFIPAAGVSWALNDYASLEPSSNLGVNWSAAAGWSPLRTEFEEGPLYLKFNIGTAQKNPSFRDLFWPSGSLAAGNPDLRPERSLNFDGGVFYSSADEQSGFSFSAEAVGFFSLLEDLIQWIPSAGGIWRPLNVGYVRSSGAELSGSLGFRELIGPASLDLVFVYNWLRTVDADSTSVNYGRQLAYRPEHSGSLSALIQLPDVFSFEVSGSYLGYRFLNNSNTKYIDPVFLLSVSAEYMFSSFFRLSVSGDNLLNLDYIDRLGYPVPGLEWSIKGVFSI